VVSARQQEEAEAVIEAAADRARVPLTLMGRDFDAWNERGRLLVQMQDRLLDLPAPSLPGEHQFANAGLAVAALLTLDDPRIDEAAMAAGIAGTVWPARFQRLTAGPLAEQAKAAGADLWLDGGHNPHAGAAVARALGDLAARDGRPVALISGLLANKDATGFFKPFAPLKAQVFTVTFEGHAAAPAAQTAAAAELAGLRAHACDSVEDALAKALALSPTPHVLICGSLYLAGEVLLAMSDRNLAAELKQRLGGSLRRSMAGPTPIGRLGPLDRSRQARPSWQEPSMAKGHEEVQQGSPQTEGRPRSPRPTAASPFIVTSAKK
jgi:dihydrofolate synthase/folylpolyglutamate synthase